MSTPIVEQIAAKLQKVVAGTTPAAGSAFTAYNAVRPAGTWPKPVTGLVVILQEGRPQKRPLTETPTGRQDWFWPFTLTAIVTPAENWTTPVDTVRNQMFAELSAAVLADPTLGGLAIDALIDEPEFWASPSGYWSVEIPVRVMFRTNYYSPFLP